MIGRGESPKASRIGAEAEAITWASRLSSLAPARL
jgi:hypothetical protein